MKRFRELLLNKNAVVVLILAVCIGFLAACGGAEESQGSEESSGSEGSSDSEKASEGGVSGNMALATYPSGIAFNSAGSGIATVLSENSNLKTSVRTFASPDAWIPMLNDGEVDIGYSDSTVNWFYTGEYGAVDKPMSNVRTLVIGNPLPNAGYIALEDSGIETLADLKGKKIGDYSKNEEGIAALLKEQLNSVGLTEEDVTMVPVSDVVQGVDMLRERKIDAAFGGDPNGSLFLEADSAVGVRGFNYGDYSTEEFEKVKEEHADSVAAAYPNMELVLKDGGIFDEERIIFSYPTTLITSTHLSEDEAYEIVKTLFENYEKLHPLFTWLESWTPETMFRPDPPTPYHPGAIKYFKEAGIWTDEAEQNHQELLGEVE